MKLLSRPLHKYTVAALAKRHISRSELAPEQMSQWADANLVQLLNSRASPMVRRVTKVVELCRKASDLTQQIKLYDQEVIKERWEENNRTITELDALIARYKRFPVIRAFHGAGPHLVVSYEPSGTGSREALRENAALQWLLDNIEVVHRIRRCRECRKWFFAVTEHQTFCGTNCRKRHASHSKDFKARRAQYMREEYRPAQKQRDLKAKKLAAGTKGR
jgi:hypothetical protein